MTTSNANLVSMVGSRLCHDLISPIGAIQNGLELLAMAGSGDTSAELDLIQDSCTSAAARIRFFRVAFGSAGSDQMVSTREARQTLEGVAKGSRLTAVWDVHQDCRREQVQLAYLAHLCCESALPMGGVITCSARDDGGLTVSAEADRIKTTPESWDFLSGGGDLSAVTPDKVQFALLATLSKDRSVPVAASISDSKVSIRIG